MEMKIRESCLQTGTFIYKPGILVTKQDFHLQSGSLVLQMGFSGYYLPPLSAGNYSICHLHEENNVLHEYLTINSFKEVTRFMKEITLPVTLHLNIHLLLPLVKPEPADTDSRPEAGA